MLPYQTIDLSMTHEHNDKLGTTLTNNPYFFRYSVCSFEADVIIATSMPFV